jgi:Phytanoyl-CoA dioxygenase (PhyH)
MRPLLRDPELQRELAHEGYVVVPLLDAELPRLRALVGDVQALLASDPRWEPRGFDELMYVADGEPRRAVHREIEAALGARLAAHLLESRIMTSNVLVKGGAPAENVVPPHQDFTAVDETVGFDSVQVWVPLVDVDRTNGCLGVLPRSHRVANPYRAQGDGTPFDSFVRAARPDVMRWLELRAGEAVLFTGRTVHASDRNRSAAPRPAIACLLAAVDAPLVHYWRLAPDRVEAFRFGPNDLRALVPGRRPTIGESVGVVEHARSAVTLEQYRAVAAD